MNEPNFLDEGSRDAPTAVLAHGAGAAMDSDWMNRMSTELVARGMRCVRFEFPYMAKRRADGKRRGPDRHPVLLGAWRQAIKRLGDPNRLIIGGKSMGGRIASMVADETGVAGLVCMGYPFHPPRSPEKLRVAHLRELQTPTLILHGERDPFGSPDEVAGYDLSDAISVHWVGDGDHSFKPRVRSGRTLQQNMSEAVV